MVLKRYTTADKCIMCVDQALATVFGKPRITGRTYPAKGKADEEVSAADKAVAARLMRINHVGEVCAQALYQSQAVTARNQSTRVKMQASSMEENDHLQWCEKRISELGGRKSLLNPVWYTGSFAIGTVAGIAGDRWSLGFVAETEKQVVKHLESHLEKLPLADKRSRAILEQMKSDEGEHATAAKQAGGSELPASVKQGMRFMSKVMTKTAYWI